MEDVKTGDQKPAQHIMAFLHGNEQKGKSALLREMGITRRQFQILGMRNGFATGVPMTFGAIADHYRVSETAIRKNFHAAEEKVRAWARTRVGERGRAPAGGTKCREGFAKSALGGDGST